MANRHNIINPQLIDDGHRGYTLGESGLVFQETVTVPGKDFPAGVLTIARQPGALHTALTACFQPVEVDSKSGLPRYPEQPHAVDAILAIAAFSDDAVNALHSLQVFGREPEQLAS